MVRRDADGSGDAQASTDRCAGYASPTDESSVPVSAGAPGSRPPVAGEIPSVEAGCRKPSAAMVGGERVHGPQHQANAAASSEKQSGGRAAHFTAKATSAVQDPERPSDPGGVRGAARVQGNVWNRRGPSGQPSSRQGCSYKPKVKASADQRESEGVVVPR